GGREYPCRLVCDIVIPGSAKTLGCFTKEFYAGGPAVTINEYGAGKAYYIGSVPDSALVSDIVGKIGLSPVIRADNGLEVTLRQDESEQTLFIINHTEAPLRAELPEGFFEPLAGQTVSGSTQIAANDVRVFVRRITA
ncbi:MAG: beta-galactosidase trimerization domain-containing protein, partial [Clostridia bacterium]|nr:beta-galactosidase trimerization domain-containing protein [Clostridia bacterium]